MSAEKPIDGPAATKDMPAVEPRPAEQPAKHGRSLTGFYVAIGVVVALALFGFWFWRSWTVWWFDADEAKRRQVDAAAKLGVPVEKTVDLGDGVKLELVLIPPGRFRMGNQAGAEDTLSCGHQWVRITKPFYMGKETAGVRSGIAISGLWPRWRPTPPDRRSPAVCPGRRRRGRRMFR